MDFFGRGFDSRRLHHLLALVDCPPWHGKAWQAASVPYDAAVTLVAPVQYSASLGRIGVRQADNRREVDTTPIAFFLLLMLTVPAYPQAAGQGPVGVEELAETPIFKTAVVSKTVQAINYQYRSGATKIDFVGTALMPRARGEAKVERKKGYIEIEVKFQRLRPPAQFGTEYLTYVMWSISPDGRPNNLGELVLNKNGQAKLNVTSELQVFGLIITAEPYFAVRVPTDLIVLQNEIRKGTKGRIFMIDTKYELLERGQYEQLANPLSLSVDLKRIPLDVYQARNALVIAKSSGAEEYASNVFGKAEASMQMLDRLLNNKSRRKLVVQNARQVTQFAEDSRELAVRRQEEEALERDRREAAEREEAARARAAEAEARRIAEKEARAKAEVAQAEAERHRLLAEVAAAKAAVEQARADAQRAQAELQREAARRAAEQARQRADVSERARMEAEQEKAELRARLLQQFSLVLETTDSDRGLVVNLSDVLFDTGQYALRPIAREKLARLAGIVLAYPGLRLQAEGHTDSTGAEEFNQRLSEQRAEAVREYLVSQGVFDQAVTSVGLGFSVPVASNDTRAGRQQNRRVEIIVSGEVIGTAVGAAAGRQP